MEGGKVHANDCVYLILVYFDRMLKIALLWKVY